MESKGQQTGRLNKMGNFPQKLEEIENNFLQYLARKECQKKLIHTWDAEAKRNKENGIFYFTCASGWGGSKKDVTINDRIF